MLKTNGGSGIFARFLAVFLCALLAGAMLLSGAGAGRAYAGMAPKAAGGTPQQGDIVYFGSYPQSWSATQAAREAVLQEESDAPTESGVSLGTLATEGDYTYSIGYFREGATYTQGAIITRYNGFGGAVVIPDTLGGYPVLQISEYDGYWGAFEGKTAITSVTIPNSVKTIGSSAFANCEYSHAIRPPIRMTFGHPFA